MEIVQTSSESMSIIEYNDEANEYFGNVPIAYQEVEYIQSSWNQYIDTWWCISPNTKISVTFQFTSSTTQQRVFWIWTDTSRSSSTDISFCVYINWSNKRARATQNWVGNRETTNVSYNTNKNTFILSNTNFTILNANWGTVYNASNGANITRTSNHGFWLMTRWKIDENVFNRNASWRLYRAQVRENNELVRDYYPCYRKSDNVIWLRDKVNRVFYTNAGSWNFTKWWNV